MNFRSVLANEVVIRDPPRHAQLYSSDVEAMAWTTYDVYHSISLPTAG